MSLTGNFRFICNLYRSRSIHSDWLSWAALLVPCWVSSRIMLACFFEFLGQSSSSLRLYDFTIFMTFLTFLAFSSTRLARFFWLSKAWYPAFNGSGWETYTTDLTFLLHCYSGFASPRTYSAA
ncbi:hypothetical protein N431DRAFT_8991 [Stipitochalara longipes BDJ]|nr:hypothetical protein N431DRAFT_8991 [Stipitochalara longipes BDJ]